jgi:hypothetical protein
MRRFLESRRSVPFLFAFITISAYGLLLPMTGFYWDDWPFAWIARFLGPAEFVPAFRGLRPFLGPIFFVTTSLIPPVPFYWQVFALVIRFLSGLSAWFALKWIFPRFERQTLMTSLLFLVFPGYSQHWVAFTHINQEWIPFIFYLLSFGFTARALRNQHVIATSRRSGRSSAFREHGETEAPKQSPLHAGGFIRNDTIHALLFLIAGVFPTEYFIGLEPLRFLFIWTIVSEGMDGFRQRFVRTLKHWLPYLLLWLGNAAWLAYFYASGTYISYDVEVLSEPLTLVHFLSTMGDVIWKAGFHVWGQVLFLTARAITAPSSILTLVLIVLTFGLLLYYLAGLDVPAGRTRFFAVSAILIGLAGMVLGRAPSFAAGLPLTLQSSNDRFMISIMLGGALFVAGLVDLIVANDRLKTALFTLLIALGIGQQFFNANIFRRDWAKQQEVYWQLAWRAPAIQPGTLLLTSYVPIDYETDNSFTAPINWMYAPDYAGGNLPYLLLYMDVRLGGPALPSLEADAGVRYSYRTVTFEGSTSQAIVFYMPQQGCLRVLDPASGEAGIGGNDSRHLAEAIHLSDVSLISSKGNAVPPFFPEPRRGWCYYYAKAELARQMKDWQRIIVLQDEVIKGNHTPQDPLEWVPFIEANAMNGDFDRAEELSSRALAVDPRVREGVCAVWERVQAQGPARSDDATRVTQALSMFRCGR